MHLAHSKEGPAFFDSSTRKGRGTMCAKTGGQGVGGRARATTGICHQSLLSLPPSCRESKESKIWPKEVIKCEQMGPARE